MKEHDFSDRKLKIAFVLALAIIGWFCFRGANLGHSQTTPANLSSGAQEVVKLSQAHMSDDVILSYIKNSGAAYNLTADDILYLNSQGVSQAVLSALLKAKADTAPSAVPPAGAPPPNVVQPATPPPAVAPASAAPPAGSEVTLPYFQAQLAPYGTWVNVPGDGLCWQPAVENSEAGWRPYFNAGHWEYTEDGWFWKSDYPWGEYVFHYGRWARDARFGWVWAPGYEWAPAWVSWRNAEAEGFCGWAPLPPGARFEPGVGLLWNGRLAVDADFGLGPDAFVFVPFGRFWEHEDRPFLPPPGRWAGLFRHSIVANGYRFIGGHFVVDGIGRERIGLLTHHEVAISRIDFHDARIARARDLQHDRAIDIMRGRGGFGRDFRGGGYDRDRRDFDHH